MIWAEFYHFRISGSIVCTQLLHSFTDVMKVASPFDHKMTIYKFDHQMAPLATNLHTRLSHMHCLIALDCPIGIII